LAKIHGKAELSKKQADYKGCLRCLPYVGGALKQQIIQAFDDDQKYGTFLQRRYEDAIFTSTILMDGEQEKVVQVDVVYSENKTSSFELVVRRNTEGKWLIVNQYSAVTQ